jgi:ankyrin repeat protein
MRRSSFALRMLSLIAVCGFALSACLAASPQAAQPFAATDHFQGKALELAQAIDRKDAAAIERLVEVEKVDPDTMFDQADMPIVAWPVINGNAEGLKLLLNAGADPNARKLRPERQYGKARDNALVFAAGLSDQTYLKLLLDHGGDPNTKNANDEPLIYVARLAHQWPNVQYLVERGANINEGLYEPAGYDTALNWYSRLGDFEQVYWLLQKGGDPLRKMSDEPGKRNFGRMPVVEDIYYLPVQPRAVEWQRRCQQWLRARNIPRPAMQPSMKQDRIKLGLPSEEKDIPLL